MDPVIVLQERSRLRQAVRIASVMWLDDARAKAREKQRADLEAKQRNSRG